VETWELFLGISFAPPSKIAFERLKHCAREQRDTLRVLVI